MKQKYTDILDITSTEKAIKFIKDSFQKNFSQRLDLLRVTAPIIVLTGTGVNDDLNGVERPVRFPIKCMNERSAEVVHSLAKWKRMKLGELGTKPGFGLFTDMNALRPDEMLDNIHSIYVDQWDWERVMTPEDRNMGFLRTIVRMIYSSIRDTEAEVYAKFPQITPILPEDITFVSSEEMLQKYPDLTPKERENKYAQQYGAIFVSGIGGALSDGSIHDGRADDYDDWTLNGDIILWNPVLQSSFEVSSMGIRVDAAALLRQLGVTGNDYKKKLLFHSMLLEGKLPQTIGGGIGQSRLCMFLLRKAHIGQVQASIWPEEMRESCKEQGIELM